MAIKYFPVAGFSLYPDPATVAITGLVSTSAQSFAGVKTFTDGAIISSTKELDTTAAGTFNIGTTNASIINIGNNGSTVNIFGSVSYIQTTNVQTSDSLITVNKGGAAGTGFGAGFEIEENSSISAYLKTSVDRNSFAMKAPNTAGVISFVPGASGFTVDQGSHQQIITVAKSGAQFTTIQAAIDSITDASINKIYLIMIAPGVYVEPITLKSYVNLSGWATGAGNTVITYPTTVISGTIQQDALTTFSRLAIVCTPITDNQSCVNVSGAIGCFDVFTRVVTSSNVTANNYTVATNLACSFSQCRNEISHTYAGSTKNISILSISGSGQFFCNGTSNEVATNSLSGTHCVFSLGNTAEVLIQNGAVVYKNTNASFSGEVRGGCVTTATSKVRVVEGADWRFTGAGSGTCSAFRLDSSGNNAEMFYAGMVLSIDGFTNEYTANTALGDTQKVWLNSINKDIGFTGLGLAIVTPYAEARTGFVAWSQDPAISTYWTYTPADKKFKVDKRFTAVVKGAPVVAAKDQFVYLTDNATNYVYCDSKGIVGVQTSSLNDSSEEKIGLFEVWANGNTNYIVVKENHPYKFPTAVAASEHDWRGVLLESAAQTMSIVNGASRIMGIAGDQVINDHGVETAFSTFNQITWVNVVQNTSSGTAYIVSTSTSMENLVSAGNNTGTTATGWHNVRLGVLKDSLNSANPTFVAFYSNVNHANASAAANSIAAGNPLKFPSELLKLEIAQLGYATISNTGVLTTITPAFQVFGAQFVSGGTSTAASLITVSPTNLDGELSSADASVQACLERLDDYDSILDWALNKTYRVGNVVRVTEEGFIGNWRCRVAQSPTSGTFSSNLEQNSTSAYWEVLSNSEGSRELINVASHGFVPGTPLARLGSAWVAASCTTDALAEVQGIVVGKTTNFFVMAKTGKLTITGAAWPIEGGNANLVDNTVYWLAATAGKITATKPTVVGYAEKPIILSNGTTTGNFVNMRGSTVGGVNAVTSIGLANNATTTIHTINVPAGSGGAIEGIIKLDAATDYVTNFKVEFNRSVDGNTYNITPQWTGTLPANFTITNSGASIQVTVPDITLTSGTAVFNYASIYQGATLPLSVSARSVLGDTSGTAVPAGSIGETKTNTISSTTVAASSTVLNQDTNLVCGGGRWELKYSVTANYVTGPNASDRGKLEVWIADSANDAVVIGNSKRVLNVKTVAAVSNDFIANLACSIVVDIPASTTKNYRLVALRIDTQGTGQATITADSNVYATRIA